MKKLFLILYLGLIVGLPVVVLAIDNPPLPSGHGESDKPQTSEPDNPTAQPKPK